MAIKKKTPPKKVRLSSPLTKEEDFKKKGALHVKKKPFSLENKVEVEFLEDEEEEEVDEIEEKKNIKKKRK